MRATLLAALLALTALLLPGAATAERQTLGYGRIFNNDLIGDGLDRWRTGSYTWSLIRGPGWQGRAPARPGQVMEYRFHTEIIAPSRLNGTGSRDRRYAGIHSLGAHTHVARGPFDLAFGADLVFTGPQTGIDDAQAWVHDRTDAPRMGVREWQIGDGAHLHGTLEAARPVVLQGAIFRPFAELQHGVEDLGRIGVDWMVGDILSDGLLLRDSVTGHLVRGIEGAVTGLGFVGGLDVTRISESLYLPAGGVATLAEERLRVRAGVHWQAAADVSFFYGLTYLGEEFEEQTEGQVLGSLKLNFAF
ncbi:hypothetical protein OG2516_14086 [Oceanicola granulosus HTCC2516]|uniref:Lipid A deacylase LpxR family protein n=1 Tax=Oceanicola granulosus (strain ATCC BAA-861 / DSM 15982 / KCTC 12143 / HTCC2516) TaxID=314256 RepID=Q2CAT7_OCEGH|nr:lipid A-modifier LpxR family protein [Oceanicola granulosus]EAR49794.1 hypothetical protein OG2516_14086 [Oceanicola granulosus HTCC2516]